MPNKYKNKVCSICGKSESVNWKRHWERRHPGNPLKELELGQLPSYPFDESWLYLIEPSILQQEYKTALSLQEVLPTEVSAEQESIEEIKQDVQNVRSPVQYIEIDDVSDANIQDEKIKEHEESKDNDYDLTSLHTKTLFKKAQFIIEIIQKRVAAREKLLRDRLKYVLRSPKKIQVVEVRHLYPASGGNHLALSRVFKDSCASASYPDRILSSIQFGVKEKIHPSTQYFIDDLLHEEQRVKQTILSLDEVVNTLHSLSLPTMLTINNSNAEIHVVEQALTLRQRNILKRTQQDVNDSKTPSEPLPIYYTPPADPVTYCPLLFGPALTNLTEERPVAPEIIKTSEIDSGDDLAHGILEINSVRLLLSNLRNEVKTINCLDLKDELLGLVDHWQAYIKRRLQYFVEMVLFPIVGYGKQKVRIQFDGFWLDDREFTINVKPRDRRGFNHDSAFFLRSLQEVTKAITDAIFAVQDLAMAFNNLKIKDEEQYELLDSLIKQVKDSIFLLKQGKEMEQAHKITQLQNVFLSVAQHLNEPDLLQDLKEKQENQKFFTTVDLKTYVQWKMQKMKFEMTEE